jgi:hypothetical protein
MYLIKSLPSAPTGNEDVEGAADSLLYTVVTESTKMLPWVMEGKRQVRAYLKVSSGGVRVDEVKKLIEAGACAVVAARSLVFGRG